MAALEQIKSLIRSFGEGDEKRVTPETKPKHPELKPHKHKPGDSK